VDIVDNDTFFNLLDMMSEQSQLICTLFKTVIALQQRNKQFEELCKQHARAIDFYINKLNEAERQLRIRKGFNDGN